MKQQNVLVIALALLWLPGPLWAQKTPDPPAKAQINKRSAFYPMTKEHDADNKEATRLLNNAWNQRSTPWRAPLMELSNKPGQHPTNLYMIALQLRHIEGANASKAIFERIISDVDARTKKMRRSPSKSMLMYKGISLYALEKFELAFATLNKIHPTKEAEWDFSPCQTILGFQNLAGVGDLTQRRAWFSSYEKRFPECSNAIEDTVLSDLFKRNQLDDVVKLLDKKLKKGLPSRNDVLRFSDLYVQAEKAEKGINLIRQFCKNNPCDEQLRDKIFRASTRTVTEAQNISDLLNRATANPKDILLQYEAAISAYFSNQYSRSLAFFENAEKAWPKDPNILAFRAMALLRTGSQKEAAKIIERAISAPKRPAVHAMFFRAIIYRNVHLDRAIESITRYRKSMLNFSGIERQEKAVVLAFEQGLRVENARRKKGEAPRTFDDPDRGRFDDVPATPSKAPSTDCEDSYYCNPNKKVEPNKSAPIQTHKMVPDMMQQLKAGTISLKTGPPAAAGQQSPTTPTPEPKEAAPSPVAPTKSAPAAGASNESAPSAQKPNKAPTTPPTTAAPEGQPRGPLWIVVGASVLLSLALFGLLFVRSRKKKSVL